MIWTIFAILGIAFYLFGTYLDFSASVKQPYYGVGEGNKFLDDKDGRFNLKKACIVYGVVLAAIIAGWFYHPAFPIVLGFAIGTLGTALGLNNRKQFQYKRGQQITFLTTLAELQRDGIDTSYHFLKLEPAILRNGRLYYKLFRWIWLPSTEATKSTDKYDLRERLKALALRDKREWFPK